jgi:hypothetical protein
MLVMIIALWPVQAIISLVFILAFIYAIMEAFTSIESFSLLFPTSYGPFRKIVKNPMFKLTSGMALLALVARLVTLIAFS